MKKFSAAATTALALVAGPALADNVGNVGAVNQSAHGTPPGAAKRSLSVGLGVQRRERIETSPYGSAQIVFNDTSTMTVGRNSAVTVDDFVYSQGGGGQQGVSMAKGVMRFVGGGVSHEGGTKLRTPTARAVDGAGSGWRLLRRARRASIWFHRRWRPGAHAPRLWRLRAERRAGVGAFPRAA
jgi:hypothetical protein